MVSVGSQGLRDDKPAVHLYDYVWLVGDGMGWWIMRIWRSLTHRDSELRGQRCSQSTEAVGMSEEERRKVQSGKCNTIELVV